MEIRNEVANELKKYTVGKKNTDKVEVSVLNLNRFIFALEEQEPCEDAISRQAVIDAIDKWAKNMHTLITLPANEVTPLFESVHKLPSVTPHYTDAEIQKMQEMEQAEIQKAYELGKASQPEIGYCKDCKHWRDSDGTYRRDIYAESKCSMNHKEVYEGTGYCFLFEPQERKVEV